MSLDPLFEQLENLSSEIHSRSDEIEKSRRLPRDLVDKLRKTGVFSLGVPRVFGGQEASPGDMLRAIETVAAADGSTGWCTMIGVANNVSAGYLNEPGAKDVYADPNVFSAGIAAPAGVATRVDGGFRVTGRWPFASGITHSEWLWAGCMVHENGKPRMTSMGPDIFHAFFPARDVQVHDTWFVCGLNGTGSNDVSVSDVFVPEHRIFDLFDPAKHRSEPLYQMPSLGTFVAQVAAVSLGIARAALDELIELAQTKIPTLSTVAIADKPVAQIEIAKAEAALASARAFLYQNIDDLWQVAKSGRQPDMRELAVNRIACLNATDTGASVARTAHQLAGGSSIYANSSLQRRMRDAEAITHHFTVAPYVWEDAGRVFLGRQPNAPIF